jgi:hypothetical protein
MSTLAITTFSEDGYNLYGKKMIRTWLQYWPKSYKLRIYAEHDLEVDDPRVEIVQLHEVSPALVKFKQTSQLMLEQTTDKKLRNKILKTVKWCHKVYAMGHALNKETFYNYLIFLDADTYTKDIVPQGQLESLSEKCLFSVHFEYLHKMRHYETGLIIFNLKHQQINDLKEYITSAYDTLEIYEMPKGWDGFWIAEMAAQRGYHVEDLTQGRRGIFTNPLVRDILHHDAGKDKYVGTNYNKFTGTRKDTIN